ncbi:MAG: hypothetical protein RJA87_275 [Pseudomonadota bacterium]|jgi:hypothetical protein
MDVLNTLSGGAVGAVMGAFGSAANRGVGLLELREKRKDRAQEIAHERAMAELVQTSKSQEALQAQTLAKVQGSYAALNASIEADRPEASYRWVAAVRSLTRPVLTLLLWILFAVMFVLVFRSGPTDGGSTQLIASSLETISFSAATALAWWFGDRAPRP